MVFDVGSEDEKNKNSEGVGLCKPSPVEYASVEFNVGVCFVHCQSPLLCFVCIINDINKNFSPKGKLIEKKQKNFFVYFV